MAAIHCASVIKPDFMNAFIEVNEESCGRVNVKMNAMSVMEWQLCYLGKVRQLFYLCANDLFWLLLFLEDFGNYFLFQKQFQDIKMVYVVLKTKTHYGYTLFIQMLFALRNRY